MSVGLSSRIGSGVRCRCVPRRVIGRVSVILIAAIVGRLPFPTLIRLRVAAIYSSVSRFVALIVDLIASIDRHIVSANVSINRVVALVLIVRAAAVIVVVVVRIVVGIPRVGPIISVSVVRRTVIKGRAMVVWAINWTVNIMMGYPGAASVVHSATVTPMRVIIIVTAEHGADRDANTECHD